MIEFDKNGNLLDAVTDKLTSEFLDFCLSNRIKISLKTGDFGEDGGIIKRSTCPDNPEILRVLGELYLSGGFYPAKYLEIFGLSKDSIRLKLKEALGNKFVPARSIYREEILQKSVTTNNERYGVANGMQSPEIKNRLKATLLEKYGVESATKISSFRDGQKSWLERNSVGNPMQLKVVQEKAEKTMVSRYGVSNAMQSKEVQEKAKLTNLKLYGVTSPAKSKEIRDKIQATNFERYGLNHAIKGGRRDESLAERFRELSSLRERFERAKENDELDSFYNNFQENIVSIASKFSQSAGLIILKEFGIKKRTNYTSEIRMQSILTSMGLNFFKNARKLHNTKNEAGHWIEADFWLPDYRIAIEVNGVAHHSSNMAALGDPKPKDYHLQKRIAFQRNNILLVGFMDFQLLDTDFVRDQIQKKINFREASKIEGSPEFFKLRSMIEASPLDYTIQEHQFKNWVYWDYGTFNK